MNKTQLIDVLAERFEGNRRQAAHALESVLDTITREVSKGERVAISGFGSFEKKVKGARIVRNPKTGERLNAAETAVAKFTPGAALKEVVAGVRKLPALVIDPVVAATGGRTSAARKAATTPARKAAASTAAAKKTPAKKSPAKKTAAKKTTAKKTAAKKTTAKKTATKKSSAKKSATKTPAAQKSTAKRSAATKS